MTKWDGEWFWFCRGCGLISKHIETLENTAILTDKESATHRRCTGSVDVLIPEEFWGYHFVTVSQFYAMSVSEQRLMMDQMRAYVKREVSLRDYRKSPPVTRYVPPTPSYEKAENTRCFICDAPTAKRISPVGHVLAFLKQGPNNEKKHKTRQCRQCGYVW